MLRRFLHSRDCTFKIHTSLEEFYSGRDCHSVLNKLHADKLATSKRLLLSETLQRAYHTKEMFCLRSLKVNGLPTIRTMSCLQTLSKWTSSLRSEQCPVYRLSQSERASLRSEQCLVYRLTQSERVSLRSEQCPVYRLTRSEQASYDQEKTTEELQHESVFYTLRLLTV